MKFIFYLLTIFSLTLNPLLAEEANKGVTLEAYLRLIKKVNSEIKEARLGVDYYESYLDEAEGALYPRFQILTLAAPTPAIRGNALDSEIDWETWGPYLTAELDAQMPIYTFGRVSKGREAALNAMEAERAKVREVISKVIYRSKEIYYGHLFAYSAYQNVLLFAQENLDEALDYAEEEYDKGSGKVTKADLGRLQVASAELDSRRAQADKFLKLTEAALNRLVGIKSSKGLKLALKELEAEEIEIKSLEYYIRRAFMNNPQWTQLQFGLQARKALYQYEENNRLPILFLAGRVKGAWAPHIDDQSSDFASDPFNTIFGGIGVGLMWEIDFSKRGKTKRAEVEYKKLVEKERFARDGIPLLVEQAYLELIEAKKKMKANYKAYRSAMGWMAFSLLAFQSGTGEAKDALEGLGAVAIYHYNYYESIYQFNMALAKLSQIVGEELAPLKY